MSRHAQYVWITVIAVIITVLVGTCTFRNSAAPDVIMMPNYRDGTVDEIYPDGSRKAVGWIEVLNESGDCIYHFYDEESDTDVQ